MILRQLLEFRPLTTGGDLHLLCKQRTDQMLPDKLKPQGRGLTEDKLGFELVFIDSRPERH